MPIFLLLQKIPFLFFPHQPNKLGRLHTICQDFVSDSKPLIAFYMLLADKANAIYVHNLKLYFYSTFVTSLDKGTQPFVVCDG